MSKDKLIIFDTTLRDGEQSPGASMTKDEKLRIAKMLEKLRVDVIEAGFAIASRGDFEARMIELLGEDEETRTFPQVDMESYLTATRPAVEPFGDKVAVVVASGQILDGRQPPGTIGGDSTAELIRRRERSRHIPIIFVTAFGDENHSRGRSHSLR